MKQLIAFFLVVFSSFTTLAQMPGAPGGKTGQQAPANIGHVYGKIVDTSGKPLGDVSLMILQNKFDTATKKRKDVLLKGIVTKTNGEFSFGELPMFGPLKLKISATGYKAIEQVVTFQMKQSTAPVQKGSNADPAQAMAAMTGALNAFDKDLGNIKLEVDVKQLEAVTVTGSKSMLRMDIDKKVFTVDKNIVSAGGTAVDVMKNVPSVQVDIDGNVSLRNAAPQIYIEGRPTTLSLDQIPADAIESVEVITNPSAKYDASGGNAGILNIILKKNKKSGYNGNIRAGVDKYGAVNGGADFNLRQDKFNFSAAFNGNQMKSKTTGTTDRLNFADTPQTFTNQINKNIMNGGFMFGRLGLDYFATNRTSFSLGVIKVHGEFSPEEIIRISTDTMHNNGTMNSYSERNSTGTRKFNANGVQFGMKQLFPKEGQELTADLNYFSGKNEGNSFYNTDYYAYSNGSKTGNLLQKMMNNGTNRFLTVQTDYVLPIKTTSKIEAGLRAQLRTLENDNFNYIFNSGTNDYQLVPNASSNYENKDNVYAAYFSFTSAIKDFGYKFGLRAESSEYEGTLKNTNQKFSNSYPVSLFPSIFLSQKLKNKQEVQFSYTRRVNRPNFFQLIPFTDYTDPLNLTKGNSNLVPEFTSSFEVSYSKSFKGTNTFLASAYFKRTDDLITRFQDKQFDAVIGEEVLISTFINANSSQSFGTELTSVNTVTKWWDLTSNINIYNSKINTDNINGMSADALWSWFGKINNNFKLPKNFTIQLSGTYQSKTNLPINQGGGGFPGMGQAQSTAQGYLKPVYGVDLAIKKTFLKNNAASATISFNDIFRTRRQQQYSYSEYFEQNYDRLRDPQMIRLTLAYRFGKMDMSLFKRKNLKSGGMEGATDGMQ
ncbi:MAG: outer membrane beta-barrel protein [Chitinophagaceae bacterium]|nr:outer membrane beta-barrel protein [Chitinophagaceae bacterium]